MFNGSSTFVRFGGSAAQWAGRSWWLVFIPGLAFVLTALAIFVWPQLLAYLVAGALMFVGVLLMGWGWTMRRATRLQARRQDVVYYDVS
jgi:uncharacterized membrane protein